MGLIQKKGQEVKEAVSKDNVDLKKVFIRLKDGQSLKVRILGVEDYVQYKAHANGYNFGIYTQPCLAPTGKECPLCKTYEYDKEEYKDLHPSNRYLVAMADLESKEVRVWDCSKTQLKGFISQLDEYAQDIRDGEEMMFTFKRSGTKTSTTYTLSPIINKKQLNLLEEAYHSFDGMVVEDSFFEACLQPRTENFIMDNLKQGGLPVEDIFPDYVFTNEGATQETTESIEDEFDEDNPPF